LTPLAPKIPNFATQILLFRLKHTVAVVTHDVLQNFYTTWVQGVACQKQSLRPKLEGDWAKGAFKIFGTPYVIFATVVASSFKLGTQIGLAKNNI